MRELFFFFHSTLELRTHGLIPNPGQSIITTILVSGGAGGGQGIKKMITCPGLYSKKKKTGI